jgi:uncharacterized protein DUF4190
MPPGAYPVQRRTNPLAIVSFVFSLAQFVVCFFIGGIVAIVTGHIARGQIKRNNEGGGGFATAGLILGYIGVGMGLLVGGGILTFALIFAPGIAQRAARDDARNFAREVSNESVIENAATQRNSPLLLRVYEREHDYGGCCNSADIHLADGTSIPDATIADWQRVGWRIEVSRTIFGTKYACFVVPVEAGDVPPVTDGRCEP